MAARSSPAMKYEEPKLRKSPDPDEPLLTDELAGLNYTSWQLWHQWTYLPIPPCSGFSSARASETPPPPVPSGKRWKDRKRVASRPSQRRLARQFFRFGGLRHESHSLIQTPPFAPSLGSPNSPGCVGSKWGWPLNSRNATSIKVFLLQCRQNGCGFFIGISFSFLLEVFGLLHPRTPYTKHKASLRSSFTGLCVLCTAAML